MQAPPNKLLARPNDGPSEGWSVSDMRIMQHGNNCYLRFPLETGVITVYGNRKTMVSKLKDALEAFDYGSPPEPAPEPAPMVAATAPPDDNPLHIRNFSRVPLDDIPPEQMIDIFYNTPSLAPVAAEFEAIVCRLKNINPDVIAVSRALDVATLFAGGQIIRGAQSRIAEALGISNAGQSNRQRIVSVLQSLKNSTTTEKSQIAEKAA